MGAWWLAWRGRGVARRVGMARPFFWLPVFYRSLFSCKRMRAVDRSPPLFRGRKGQDRPGASAVAACRQARRMRQCLDLPRA